MLQSKQHNTLGLLTKVEKQDDCGKYNDYCIQDINYPPVPQGSSYPLQLLLPALDPYNVAVVICDENDIAVSIEQINPTNQLIGLSFEFISFPSNNEANVQRIFQINKNYDPELNCGVYYYKIAVSGTRQINGENELFSCLLYSNKFRVVECCANSIEYYHNCDANNTVYNNGFKHCIWIDACRPVKRGYRVATKRNEELNGCLSVEQAQNTTTYSIKFTAQYLYVYESYIELSQMDNAVLTYDGVVYEMQNIIVSELSDFDDNNSCLYNFSITFDGSIRNNNGCCETYTGKSLQYIEPQKPNDCEPCYLRLLNTECTTDSISFCYDSTDEGQYNLVKDGTVVETGILTNGSDCVTINNLDEGKEYTLYIRLDCGYTTQLDITTKECNIIAKIVTDVIGCEGLQTNVSFGIVGTVGNVVAVICEVGNTNPIATFNNDLSFTNNLGEGEYLLKVTDNVCTKEFAFTVLRECPCLVEYDLFAEPCTCDEDGNLTVKSIAIVEGTGALTWNICDSQNTSIANGSGLTDINEILPVGTYQIKFFVGGDLCDSQSFTIADDCPCDSVTNIVIQGVTADTVTITWTGVANALNYCVELYEVVSGIDPLIDTNTEIDTTTVFNGLDCDTTYFVKVITKCTKGEADSKDTPFFTTDVCPCDCETPQVLKTVTATDITFSWNNTANAYIINILKNGNSVSQTVINSLSYTIDFADLDCGEDYVFSLVAECEKGCESLAFLCEFDTPECPCDCDPPTNLNYNFNGTDHVFNWTGTGQFFWLIKNSLGSTILSNTITGNQFQLPENDLTCDETHTLEVYKICKDCDSPTVSLSFITPDCPCDLCLGCTTEFEFTGSPTIIDPLYDADPCTYLANWNAKFEVSTLNGGVGNLFTGIEIVGNTIRLCGGSNLKIVDSAFQDNQLVSVDDSDCCAIVEIGGWVFRNSSNSNNATLTTIDMPCLLEINGSVNWFKCDSLITINHPALQTINGNSNWDDCSSLITVNYPSLVDINGTKNWDDCSSLITVNYPSLVNVNGDRNWENCDSLVTTNYPSLVNINGSNNWLGCDSLFTVNYPVLQTINGNSNWIFSLLITTANYPLLTTIIGNGNWQNCTSLTSLLIPICTQIGATVGDENNFSNANNASLNIDIDPSMLTDGDIAYHLGQGGTTS